MFLVSFQNVLSLLLMAIPAFALSKFKLIKEKETSSILSVFLLYVCTPLVTINSFLNTKFSVEILKNLLIMVAFTMILYVVLAFIFGLILKVEKNRDKRGILTYASTFGNVGYMAIPFLQILTNNNLEIILYAATSMVAFNLVTWTLGCFYITGDKQYIRAKKAFLNPPTLVFLLILPLFILNFNFQKLTFLSPIQSMAKFFADSTGVLSMSLVGVKLSNIKFMSLFTDGKTYLATFLKLIASPVICMAIILLCQFFIDISAVKFNLIVLAAMPAANNLIMFCSLYEKDGEQGAKVVLLSTLMSILTIPLMLAILI